MISFSFYAEGETYSHVQTIKVPKEHYKCTMEINDRRLDDDKNANSILFANFTADDDADPCQVVEFQKEENSKWSLKTGILPSAHPERVPT